MSNAKVRNHHSRVQFHDLEARAAPQTNDSARIARMQQQRGKGRSLFKTVYAAERSAKPDTSALCF
eukprot:3074510-Lingulodinium_polyedra.AAC.1